jgi:hypothetical protein
MVVLFLGSRDALSLSVQVFLHRAGVRFQILQDDDLSTRPEIVFRALQNLDAFAGVLTHHLFRTDRIGLPNVALDRFAAEWTAMFGGALFQHPNVLNPPTGGFWNGSMPIYPELLPYVDETELRALDPEQFRDPALLTAFADTVLRDETNLFRFPQPTDGTCYEHCLRLFFCDSFLLKVPDVGLPQELEADLQYLVDLCRREFRLRIGEIGVEESGRRYRLSYLTPRPQIQACLLAASPLVDAIAAALLEQRR